MLDSSVDIRKVGTNELQLLKELATETFIESWMEGDNAADIASYVKDCFNDEQLSRDLTDSTVSYLLIKVNGLPVGYCKFQYDAQPEDQLLNKPIAIHRLYISNVCQGLKLGTALINEVIAVAKRADYKNVWLGVWNKNLGAIRLYERMGFEIFGNYKFVMGSIVSDDYLMKLDITGKTD